MDRARLRRSRAVGVRHKSADTQIMNLLLLAPDLQEHLLLPPTTIDERRLRNVAKIVEWREQRKCFTIALDKRKDKDGLAG